MVRRAIALLGRCRHVWAETTFLLRRIKSSAMGLRIPADRAMEFLAMPQTRPPRSNHMTLVYWRVPSPAKAPLPSHCQMGEGGLCHRRSCVRILCGLTLKCIDGAQDLGARRQSHCPTPQPAVPVRSNAQSRRRFPADDPIDFQAIGSLEGHHCGLCTSTENAIGYYAHSVLVQFFLQFPDLEATVTHA
jgi:hypothetical protein